MSRLAAMAAAALSLAGLAAALAWRGSRGTSAAGAGAGKAAPEMLTPQRVAALRAVAEVVPSQYPDAIFAKLAPSYKPEDPAWRASLQAVGVNPDAYTTCGELPRYVGDRLPRPVNTKGGLSSIRDLGVQTGAWTVATGSNRPKPGDFYLLSADPAGKTILHTGVIVDATGSSWRTADAGQGGHPNQAAAYQDRAYDPAANTLGGLNGAHYLVGWYDIDKGAQPIA